VKKNLTSLKSNLYLLITPPVSSGKGYLISIGHHTVSIAIVIFSGASNI